MKRALVVLSLTATALAGIGVRAAEVCSPPRCIDVVVPVPADLIVPDSTVRVLLPEGYDPNALTRYPVLYLLHGNGDTYRTWSQNTDVIAFTRDYPLIVVMPDGGHGPDSGWYSDWADGSRHWESFHIGILIDYIDTTYRTMGDDARAIAGLSMGGFGAMSYAGRHPELFEAAASFSGHVNTRFLTPASGVSYTLLNDRFGTPNDNVWGNQITEAEEWAEHNPKDLAPSLAGIELFVASGTGTPGGPAGDDPDKIGGYGQEFFLHSINQSFLGALRRAGVPYHADMYIGGYHGWPYWERELHWALPQMLDAID